MMLMSPAPGCECLQMRKTDWLATLHHILSCCTCAYAIFLTAMSTKRLVFQTFLNVVSTVFQIVSVQNRHRIDLATFNVMHNNFVHTEWARDMEIKEQVTLNDWKPYRRRKNLGWLPIRTTNYNDNFIIRRVIPDTLSLCSQVTIRSSQIAHGLVIQARRLGMGY